MRSSWRRSRPTRGSSGSSPRSEEHTSELQSRQYLVCRLLLEKKKKKISQIYYKIYKTDTTKVKFATKLSSYHHTSISVRQSPLKQAILQNHLDHIIF